MGRQQKNKGASFERSICQKLSLWASGFTREDIFWRSAMSGGRATHHSRQGKKPKRFSAMAGDISAIHDLGRPILKLFVLECKHYASLRMEPMIFGGTPADQNIWLPTKEAADKLEKEPLIFAKQNHRDILMLTTKAGREILLRGFKRSRDLPLFAAFPKYGMWVMPFRPLLINGDYRLLCGLSEQKLAELLDA